MFYFGRTLPNIYALVLVLCAYAFWLKVRYRFLFITATQLIPS